VGGVDGFPIVVVVVVAAMRIAPMSDTSRHNNNNNNNNGVYSTVITLTRPSSLPINNVFSSLDMVKLMTLLSVFSLYCSFKL
jgi:hypothetical protein